MSSARPCLYWSTANPQLNLQADKEKGKAAKVEAHVEQRGAEKAPNVRYLDWSAK